MRIGSEVFENINGTYKIKNNCGDKFVISIHDAQNLPVKTHSTCKIATIITHIVGDNPPVDVVVDTYNLPVPSKTSIVIEYPIDAIKITNAQNDGQIYIHAYNTNVIANIRN